MNWGEQATASFSDTASHAERGGTGAHSLCFQSCSCWIYLHMQISHVGLHKNKRKQRIRVRAQWESCSSQRSASFKLVLVCVCPKYNPPLNEVNNSKSAHHHHTAFLCGLPPSLKNTNPPSGDSDHEPHQEVSPWWSPTAPYGLVPAALKDAVYDCKVK